MSRSKGYTLDSEDRLVAFWGEWGDFDWTAYVGSSLWSLLSSDELSQLLTEFFHAARRKKQDLSTTFRCSMAEEILELELLVRYRGEGSLDCQIRTAGRVDVSDSDSQEESEPSYTVLCSWCGRVKRGGEWVEVDAAFIRLGGQLSTPGISHGLCESCSEKLFAEITKL